ncbi:MAG: DUF2712 domain-containing protein [Clostridium sp.]
MKKILIGIALVGVLAMPSVVKAADNNIGFSFYIKSFHQNGQYGTPRYRETENYTNPWKVDLQKSSEGKGNTITRFWIEKSDGTNASEAIDVPVKGGARYHNAYKAASKVNVFLTGENNNYNSAQYTVSGVWDEETW